MAATAWLASYPKSGNTWIRALFNALENDDEPNINALDSGMGHESVDTWLGISTSNLNSSEVAQIARLSWAHSHPGEAGFHRRKTHQAWVDGTDGYPARWQPAGARAIYIARDPRAVAVSWAHHNGISHADAVEFMANRGLQSLEAWPSHQAHAGWSTGSWSEHVTSWRDQIEIPTLLLTYEQLSTEPVLWLSKMAKWLEIETDAAACERAVERCGFERLAAQEVVTGFAEAASVDRAFFRRGSVDSWRRELSNELIERIETDHAQVMRDFGYLD